MDKIAIELYNKTLQLIGAIGPTDAALFILVVALYLSFHFQVKGRLKDRQKEIDRLAGDNHLYRDRFLSLIDKNFNYKEQEKTK